jgi:rod shape-determining protein MreC
MSRSLGDSRRHIIIFLMVLLSLGLTAVDRKGALVADRARILAAHVFAPSQGWLKNFTLSLIGDGSSASARREPAAPVDDFRGLSAAQQARIEDLQRQLAEVLGLQQDLAEQRLSFLPAHVLSRNYLGSSDNLKIDAGSSRGAAAGHWVLNRCITRGKGDGVHDGLPVLTGNGLVGIVDQVGEGFSMIRLVTSEKCILTARVMHWDAGAGQWIPQPSGQMRGTGDGQTMKLDRIPRTANVAPGDFVVTAGTEAGLPEYVIAGVVKQVSSRPTDGSYSILVEPRVNLEAMDQVYVLSPRPDK